MRPFGMSRCVCPECGADWNDGLIETPLDAKVIAASSRSRRNRQAMTTTERKTTMPRTIDVNGETYVLASEAPEPSPWRIVIAQRGWVFVGRYDQDGEHVTLTDASVIRVWGTTKGLGELVDGPIEGKTVLDPAGTVRLHELAVVATLDCGPGWGV